MIHRLLVPLAIRSFLVAIVLACILCVLLAPARLLQGEPAVAATLGESSPPFAWSGQPVESNDLFDQAACTETQTCDVFRVKVDVSNQYRQLHPDFALAVRISWDGSDNDFDLYLNRDGRIVKRSARWHTDSEELHLLKPANGVYEIFVHAAGVEPATAYRAQAKLMETAVDMGR
jgi:hypothetical protein